MITFTKELRKAYYGAKSIASIYVGDTLVWPINRPPAGPLFIGSVLRYIHGLPIGKLSGDVASNEPILYTIAEPIFILGNDGNIRPTEYGIMPGSCFEADAVKITPTKIEANKIDDTLFKIDNSDRIVIKE